MVAAVAAMVLHVLFAAAGFMPAAARSTGFSAPICHFGDTAGAGERHKAPAVPSKPCLACPVCAVGGFGGLVPAGVLLPGAPLLGAVARLVLPPARAPPGVAGLRPPATGPPT